MTPGEFLMNLEKRRDEDNQHSEVRPVGPRGAVRSDSLPRSFTRGSAGLNSRPLF